MRACACGHVSCVWISLSTTWQAVIDCRDCKYPSPLDHILFQGSSRPSEAELKLPCLLLQFPGTELCQFLHRNGALDEFLGRFLGMRYVGVQWFNFFFKFFMLSNFFRLYLHNITRVVLANLRWYMCKKRIWNMTSPVLGPPHTRDWDPVTITLQALSLVEKTEPVQVCFTRHAWGTNGVCGCNMINVKVYMDSYMASNGSCFMVTWIIFKNHLLEVGLTQNWETWHSECSQPLIDFIWFHHVWEPAWIEIHWNSIWLRAWPRIISH